MSFFSHFIQKVRFSFDYFFSEGWFPFIHTEMPTWISIITLILFWRCDDRHCPRFMFCPLNGVDLKKMCWKKTKKFSSFTQTSIPKSASPKTTEFKYRVRWQHQRSLILVLHMKWGPHINKGTWEIIMVYNNNKKQKANNGKSNKHKGLHSYKSFTISCNKCRISLFLALLSGHQLLQWKKSFNLFWMRS